MNTRDLGIGAGKGDKSRVTSAEVFRARFPDSMGPKTTRVRSTCCEAPFVIRVEVTRWPLPKSQVYSCLSCGNVCDIATYEIT